MEAYIPSLRITDADKSVKLDYDLVFKLDKYRGYCVIDSGASANDKSFGRYQILADVLELGDLDL